MNRILPALLFSLALPALAQSPKPTSSSTIKLTEFAIPPFPVQVVGLSAKNGTLDLLTQMPIAGRPLPTAETPKPRGAEFPTSAAYLCHQLLDTQGQATGPARSMVFASAQPTTQPADFAVFGTRAADGPMRLPLGGGMDQLTTQFPDLTTFFQHNQQVSLLSTGPGLNYANYKLAPRYRTASRAIEPASGRLLVRTAETAPQRTATEAQLGAYVAVDGSNLNGAGLVITLSPTRYQGVATRYVDGDKNASARNANFLTFDEGGTLLQNQPVTFAYNRTLSGRLPVHDVTGKVVGSLNVFSHGPGKKDMLDPEESRFTVVITDEEGKLWSQFEWVTGGSSGRAAVPVFALRKGDEVLLYTSNQQKLLKPTQESWIFTKAGKATLLGSIPASGIYDLSKSTGVVNGGEQLGWYFFTNGYYLDSFAGADGSTWVVMQRQRPVFGIPGVSTLTPTVVAAPPVPSSGLGGFASRLGQMSGALPSTRTTPAPVVPGVAPNDLFVLRFDDKMQLQSQMVVGLRPRDAGPLSITRAVRPTGSDLFVGDANGTWLRMRGNTLTVNYLTLSDRKKPIALGQSHAAFDETSGMLYVLSELPQQAGKAQLDSYPLD